MESHNAAFIESYNNFQKLTLDISIDTRNKVPSKDCCQRYYRRQGNQIFGSKTVSMNKGENIKTKIEFGKKDEDEEFLKHLEDVR